MGEFLVLRTSTLLLRKRKLYWKGGVLNLRGSFFYCKYFRFFSIYLLNMANYVF
jgi:hypothetical protein